MMVSSPARASCKRTAKRKNTTPTKRIKTNRKNADEESVEDQAKFLLHNDLADILMSFLGPRELLSFISTKKDMVSFLTYEHVVRAGLMHSRYSKITVERIVESIDKLWVPSPFRLLQLVNGKRCERCNKKRVHHTLHQSGLFLCKTGWVGCGNDSMHCHTEWGSDHPAFLQHVIYHYMLSNRHFLFDNLGPGKNGPLLTDTDVKLVGYNEEKVRELLLQRQESDPNRMHASSLKQLADTYHDQAQRREEERESIKKDKLAKAIENKKKKIQAIIDTLARHWDGKPWKDIALAHKWTMYQRNGRPLLEFELKPLQSRMHDFIVTPSKSTEAKLEEIAREISKIFSVIYKYNLQNLSFFNDEDAFERLWKERTLSNGLSMKERIHGLAGAMDKHGTWREGKRLTVMDIVIQESGSIQENCSDKLFNDLVMPVIHGPMSLGWLFEQCTLPGILSSTAIPENRRALAGRLATGLWDWEYESKCFAIRERYHYCCKTFPALLQATIDFIAEYNLDEDATQVNFAQIMERFCKDKKTLQPLLDKKFFLVWRRALWLQQRV